jgi:hypothetical protein
VCGLSDHSEAHHIIGIGDGGTGTKACDLLSMPVCNNCHVPKFHRLDIYPELRDEQWKWVAKTLQKAIKEGLCLNNICECIDFT